LFELIVRIAWAIHIQITGSGLNNLWSSLFILFSARRPSFWAQRKRGTNCL